MAVLLTSSPAADAPALLAAGRVTWLLGVVLALALNPLVNELRPIVEWLFPISQVVKEALGQMMNEASRAWAWPSCSSRLIPAICEELAFRGFILSGLERGHRTRSAILLSALLFGFLHVLLSLFQQLFNATLLGIVLGLLAVRSRSILPGILFHFLNNALAVVMGTCVPGDRRIAGSRPGSTATRPSGLYHWWWIVRACSGLGRAACMALREAATGAVLGGDAEARGKYGLMIGPRETLLTRPTSA